MKEQLRWAAIGLAVTLAVCGVMAWWALGPEIRQTVDQECAVRGRGPVFGAEWDSRPEPMSCSFVVPKECMPVAKTDITNATALEVNGHFRDTIPGLHKRLASWEMEESYGIFYGPIELVFALVWPFPFTTAHDVQMIASIHLTAVRYPSDVAWYSGYMSTTELDAQSIDWEYSIKSSSSRINRTRTVEPWRGSTVGPTHAIESRFGDSWEVLDPPSCEITFGPVSLTIDAAWAAQQYIASGGDPFFEPGGDWLTLIPLPDAIFGVGHVCNPGLYGDAALYAGRRKWAEVTVNSSEAPWDFTAIEQYHTPLNKGGPHAIIGNGNALEFWADVDGLSVSDTSNVGLDSVPHILDLRETGLCGWGGTAPDDDLYGDVLHWLWNGYAVCPVWRYQQGPLWVAGDATCAAPPGTYPAWAGPLWNAVDLKYDPMWNPLDAACPYCGSQLRPGGMLKVPWESGWPDMAETDWISTGEFQDSTEAPLTQAQLHSIFDPYAQRLTPYAVWDKKAEYAANDYDLLSGGKVLLVDRVSGRTNLLPDTITAPGGVPVIPIHVGGCNSTDCSSSPYFDLTTTFDAVDVDMSGTTGTRVSAWTSTDFAVTNGAVGTAVPATFTVPAAGGTLTRGPLIDPYWERNAAMIAATAGGAFSESYIYHQNNTAVSGGWPAGWSDEDCMGGGHAGVDVTWWATHRYATLVATPTAGWDGVTLPQLKLTYSTEAVEDNLYDSWPAKDVEVTVASAGLTLTITGKRNGDTVYYDLVYPGYARLEHVTQVEVIFAADATGAWTLNGFRLDPSDAAPGSAAELSTTTMHQCHHSYDWGGIRGVIDGRCTLALRATDSGAALYQPRHVWKKGLEELIPDVNEVYTVDPIAGILDVSVAYSLEKYARLMDAVGEGWNMATPANWNSIYKDGDGTVLSIGYATDVVENQDYGGVQCGFSGWMWSGVAGLCYTPHGVLCAQGGMHGLSNATSACCGIIFRKAPAAVAWDEYHDDIGADEHGYWSSGADVVHHYDVNDAIEYMYRVNYPPRNTDFERVWERQWVWAWLHIPALGGNLALTQHFSGAILVTDVGLSDPNTIGEHKIQRGVGWSQRFAVPDSEDALWANILTTNSRMELVEGQPNVQTRKMFSLDGDWQTAELIEAGYTAPYGIEVGGRFYICAYKDEKQYLLRSSRAEGHASISSPIVIADEDVDADVAACIAGDSSTRLLAAAVQRDGHGDVYCSSDSGQTWEGIRRFGLLTYPYIFADAGMLWVTGYSDNPIGAASGRAWSMRCSMRNARTVPLDGHIWAPVGVYAEGRIDTYEGVDCSGECDQFTQRFWEEKFDVRFVDDWWQKSFAEMVSDMPEGSTYAQYHQGDLLLSGDILIFYAYENFYHAAILDHVDGNDVYVADTNHDWDSLGYYSKYLVSNIVGVWRLMKTVGAADEGRSAIIRNATTRELTVVVPKTTDWGLGEAAPAIVEYTSTDTGQTWTQKAFHGLT